MDTTKNEGVNNLEVQESGSAKSHRQGSRSAAKGEEDNSEESDDDQDMGNVHDGQSVSREQYDTIISMT